MFTTVGGRAETTARWVGGRGMAQSARQSPIATVNGVPARRAYRRPGVRQFTTGSAQKIPTVRTHINFLFIFKLAPMERSFNPSPSFHFFQRLVLGTAAKKRFSKWFAGYGDFISIQKPNLYLNWDPNWKKPFGGGSGGAISLKNVWCSIHDFQRHFDARVDTILNPTTVSTLS